MPFLASGTLHKALKRFTSEQLVPIFCSKNLVRELEQEEMGEAAVCLCV